MLLIHPPVSKPCEPPAGIARLAGALREHGVACRILDANMEGLLCLLEGNLSGNDTWTKRALRHLDSNLASLHQWHLYGSIDRYRRSVKDVNRVLEMAARPFGVRISLANYQDQRLSPVRSEDLVVSFEKPEANPFYNYFSRRLTAVFEDREPSIVGFSLNYLSQAFTTFSMIGFIRKLSPRTRIVLGGGLVSSWMSNPEWTNPFTGCVDDMVSGPGEKNLLEMCEIEVNDTPNYSPAYDELPVESYFAPGYILPYSASLGCYWRRCSFCPERAEGSSYISAPVDDIISQIESLIADRKPSLLHFLDNAMSPALLSGIADVPMGVPWYGFARVFPGLMDSEFCMNLKRAGCVMLKLGIESGSQRVLDDLQKGINLEEASLALKTLRKTGIIPYVYLLFGTPAETFSEAEKTLEFVVEHREDIGFLNISIFNMPAYGPDSNRLETKDFYFGDLSLYRQFRHPKGWHRHEVRRFLDREFKRNSAVASIIRRDPPFFTSNHAPFFVMASKRSMKT